MEDHKKKSWRTCGIGICLWGSTKSGFGGKSRSKNMNFCLSETPSNLYFGSCSNFRFSSSESSGFGIRRDVTSISPEKNKKKDEKKRFTFKNISNKRRFFVFFIFSHNFVQTVEKPREKLARIAAFCELKAPFWLDNDALEEFVRRNMRSIMMIFPQFSQQLAWKKELIKFDWSKYINQYKKGS